MAYAFELNGTAFRGKALDPEKSLDGFALLAPLLGPLLDGIDPEKLDDADAPASIIKGALAAFAGLPKLRPMFLPVYEVAIDNGKGDKRFMPLGVSTIEKQVFGGHPALAVGWLVAAIHAEYGDFLGPDGRNTLSSLAGILGFRSTPGDTGQSGDS